MKKQVLLFTALFLTVFVFAQDKKYQLSTHILDVSQGLPAKNVSIKLEKMGDDKATWEVIAEKTTDNEGRINDFLPSENKNDGIYRFTFFTEAYFEEKNVETFYPFIEVVFELKDAKHYHVPITLSAFGYSTYRGS